MHEPTITVLFLSDTHLGFDWPFKPRIERRRRGPDFFANFEKALRPALAGEADLVIHGGDILYRSKAPPKLVEMVFEPLRRVAGAGVPVCLVPGNHERSAIPYRVLAAYEGIHIFDKPGTFLFEKNGLTLALAGFPYERNNIRGRFKEVLAETEWDKRQADRRILCIHHCVEGAAVGPQNYTFRYGDDVIRINDFPVRFDAVFSGHIHRHQVLRTDLKSRPVPVPVFYPGSTERTTFAEMNEEKGYLLLKFTKAGSLVSYEFKTLPARPMRSADIDADGLDAEMFELLIKRILADFEPDAVARLRIKGKLPENLLRIIRAENIRTLAPATMNVEIILPDERAAFYRKPVDKR